MICLGGKDLPVIEKGADTFATEVMALASNSHQKRGSAAIGHGSSRLLCMQKKSNTTPAAASVCQRMRDKRTRGEGRRGEGEKKKPRLRVDRCPLSGFLQASCSHIPRGGGRRRQFASKSPLKRHAWAYAGKAGHCLFHLTRPTGRVQLPRRLDCPLSHDSAETLDIIPTRLGGRGLKQ